MNGKTSPEKGRLASLDILRGFDLFLLVFFQPVFMSLARKLDAPWLEGVMRQFEHVPWEGFRVWDLIMPLFMFMAGASMPFSFAKFGDDKRAAYLRIARRVVLLFIFGMVVQGNLLGLDPHRIYLYSNTLQAIAAGYLIASVAMLHCKLRGQIAVAVLLLVAYWVPMTLLGDFTPDGNFAEAVDRAVLGRFRDGVYWDDAGWHFSDYYHYTWILSSLTFGVTVLLGSFAGRIVREGRDDGARTVKRLVVIGAALVAIALLWSLQMSIIKTIWSCSMTLFAGGICFILMGVFYYWIDYKGHTRGLGWLKIYGMNSITAYVLAQVVNFRCIASSLTYGLEQYMGEYYDVWLDFANYLIIFLILMAMYRRRIFLRL